MGKILKMKSESKSGGKRAAKEATKAKKQQ